MIRTLIIDDEQLARLRIRRLLEPFYTSIKVIGECKSGTEAVKAIKQEQPDLIFLDIHMKDMSGFDVLNRLSPDKLPTIVFITAYDQYAIKAFDYFAFDYLLKPIQEDRFIKSVRRIVDHVRSRSGKPGNPEIQSLLQLLHQGIKQDFTTDQETISVKYGGKICFLKKKEVQYVEASGYYIEVYTTQKKYLIRESLGTILDKLGNTHFVRIHRSTIINTNFLREINSIGFGDVEVRMKDEKVFRVSKSYKEQLYKKMGLQ